MAMVLDAFVGTCTNKLAIFIEEKVVMVLGVKEELKKLQRRMEMINNVLRDAETKKIQDSAINAWVRELKDVMYDADDILDLCRIEGAKLLLDDVSTSSVNCRFPLFSCFTTIPARHEIGYRIKSLNERLKEISQDRLDFNLEHTKSDAHNPRVDPRQTSPILVESDIVGRDIQNDTVSLVQSLITEGRQKCCIFAIVGMGGIGKTTLAQNIFNESRIQAHFQIKIWACVSQTFSEIDLLKEMIRKAGGKCGDANSKSELLPFLKTAIFGKSFFLVLDDIWQADVWVDLLRNPLQAGAVGSRVLITTRDEMVAKKIGAVHTHWVKLLPIEFCWELLCKFVFVSGNDEEEIESLRDVGIQIVEKCHGLPLAIKIISGVLATKERRRREWEMVLRSNMWSVNMLPDELRGALYLSYEDLPSHLKQCFLYCSLFPEDYTFSRQSLILGWVAQGFVETKGDLLMEDVANEYYEELIKRNLLLSNPRNYEGGQCKMHDLLRSLAQFLSRDESFYGDARKLDTTTTIKLRHLSMEGTGHVAVIPERTMEQKCLRTLLLIKSPPTFDTGLLEKLPYLRVLVLNGPGIDNVPVSLGNLKHLRLLDLDRTVISKLPDSLAFLTNLQILNLAGCKSLHVLPKGITRLLNLRRLGLRDTPLSYMPKGLEKLKQLNNLEGFVVGDDQEEACNLQELEPLSQLRLLRINNLGRKLSSALPLTGKPHLKILRLYFSRRDGAAPITDEEVDIMEELIKEPFPLPNLDDLQLDSFFGRKYPSWMLSSSLASHLPNLTKLALLDCSLCPQLPPLGRLPQLKILVIRGSSAIVTIGPELLSSDPTRRAAFPKLQLLKFVDMPNWEEWSFGEEQNNDSDSRLLLPQLHALAFEKCMKLRAVPGGLNKCPIQRVRIQGAHDMKEVGNFPCLTDWMELFDNQSLEKVADLPSLRKLVVRNCPALKFVENLDALQHMELEDGSIESLPEWLVRKCRQNHDDFLRIDLKCNIRMLKGCLKGGQHWPIIQQISQVNVYELNGSGNLFYSKEPFSYVTNL